MYLIGRYLSIPQNGRMQHWADIIRKNVLSNNCAMIQDNQRISMPGYKIIIVKIFLRTLEWADFKWMDVNWLDIFMGILANISQITSYKIWSNIKAPGE